MSPQLDRPARPRRLPWPALPILAYVAITVALPALHGAASSPAFWRHALWIFAGCAVVGVAMWALGEVLEWTRLLARYLLTSWRRARRSPAFVTPSAQPAVHRSRVALAARLASPRDERGAW